ncbi:unnamed protein product, partial [Didymodactylos carnosus]
DHTQYLNEIQDEKPKCNHLLEQLQTWLEQKQKKFTQLNDTNCDEKTLMERMNRIEGLDSIKDGYSILKNIQNLKEKQRRVLNENDEQSIDKRVKQYQ